MNRHIRELGRKLSREIPVTRRLGISVRVEDDCLVLALPLERNRNDKGTAFAGSICAAATLAGWAAIWLALREAGVEAPIVIQDSAIRYRRPVTRDFEARCRCLTARQKARLLAALKRGHNARLRMRVGIADAVLFSGRYVVLAKRERDGNKTTC